MGNQGVETGVAISLVETKHKKKILDGWCLDVFKGKRLKTKVKTVGIGIEKTILKKKIFEVGAGIFATKPLETLLDWSIKDASLCFGLTGTWKF